MAKARINPLQAAFRKRQQKASVRAVNDLPDELLALLGDNPSAEDIREAIALSKESAATAAAPATRNVARHDYLAPEEAALSGEYYLNQAKTAGAARAASRLERKAPVREATLARLKKAKWGKAIGYGGAALGAYSLLDAVGEARTNSKLVGAIENMPDPTPQDYLQAMEDEELLARRDARLMRNAPEAYAILKGIAVGRGPKKQPAVDAIRIGGMPVPPDVMEQNTQDLLSALLR